MTIDIQTYVRKPFDVEAVQVTAENMDEVARWCKGKIKNEGTPYILVRVHNAANDRHKQAFAGDWIFYSKTTGHKVYSDRAFTGSFKPKNPNQGVKPEISVAQVLVDEHNAGLKATDDVVHRDAGTGKFVSEEYAEKNQSTTVKETITVKEGELSPEDQARLLP